MIRLAPRELERLLGVSYDSATIEGLSGLTYEKPRGSSDELHCPPRCGAWDMEQAADLVEEVARIDGYDKIPAHPDAR